MSPDYDAADGPVGSQSEAYYFGNMDAQEAPVWKPEIVLDLKPERMNQRYKTHACMSDLRFQTTNQDEKTIDVAQVYIASDYGTIGNMVLGKLIVEYCVELMIPQIPTESSGTGFAYRGTSANGNLSTSSYQRIFQSDLVTSPVALSQDLNNPILQLNSTLFTVPKTFSQGGTNSNVVGQFLKNFEGYLMTQYSGGTNYATAGTATLSNNADNILDGVTQSFVNQLSTINSGYANDVWKIVAKVGDILKVQPVGSATAVGTPAFSLTLAETPLSNIAALI